MTRFPKPREEQLLDLLAERAVFGLHQRRRHKLQRLLAETPILDPDCLDRLAASLTLAGQRRVLEPLPRHLRTAVRQTALDALRKQLHRESAEDGGYAKPTDD